MQSSQKVRINQHPDKRTVPALPYPSASPFYNLCEGRHNMLDTHSQDCQELRRVCTPINHDRMHVDLKTTLTLEQSGFEQHDSLICRCLARVLQCYSRLVESVDAEEPMDERAAPQALCCSRATVHSDVEEIGARQCWALMWTQGTLTGSWHHYQAHRQEPLPFYHLT